MRSSCLSGRTSALEPLSLMYRGILRNPKQSNSALNNMIEVTSCLDMTRHSRSSTKANVSWCILNTRAMLSL